MRQVCALLMVLVLSIFLIACEEETSSEVDLESATPPAVQDPEDAYTEGMEPTPVPDLQMTTMDGEELSLADFRDEVVVLNFWATWCGPCRVEVPDLIELQNNLEGQGLTILGIAVGEDEDQIRPFAEEFGINYPLIPDASREISEAFEGIYGLPTTIVVNPEGQQVERIIGLFSVPDMQGRIQTMLAQR